MTQNTNQDSPNVEKESGQEDGVQETFLSHLFELRDRLIKSVGAMLFVFLGISPWVIAVCGHGREYRINLGVTHNSIVEESSQRNEACSGQTVCRLSTDPRGKLNNTSAFSVIR